MVDVLTEDDYLEDYYQAYKDWFEKQLEELEKELETLKKARDMRRM